MDVYIQRVPFFSIAPSLKHPDEGSQLRMVQLRQIDKISMVTVHCTSTHPAQPAALLQAIGRGDLQGRAASLCISEVRMCLSACADRSGPGDDDRRSASTIHRRVPLAQLRELAGVCLSFSMDAPSVARAGVYAGGGRRGAEDANNRRVLMLEALPAVLGACAVAAAEEEEDDDDDDGTDEDDDNHKDHSSESDSDRGEEGADAPMAERGRGGRGRGGRASATTAATAAAAAGKKGKGKGKSGGSNDGRRWSSISGRADGSIRKGARHNPRSKVAASGGGGGWGRGGLPERGEAILRDVTDALLGRPWPLRLVLPLLVVFEEIYGLVELLDCRRARQPPTQSAGGGTAGNGSVWARVRSRLMETVWMGGLDGADFTGVVRQVRLNDIHMYSHSSSSSSSCCCCFT